MIKRDNFKQLWKKIKKAQSMGSLRVKWKKIVATRNKENNTDLKTNLS